MIHFVLVEPAVPENVGAAARALKTMGFGELWIVNSTVHTDKQARILAHGSGDILDNVRTFDSLAAVRAEVDLMVGTSAKPRHQREVLLTPEALKTNLADKLAGQFRIALVFGREDSGLHGPEVAQCDLLTSIPLAVTYPSLNLGQAVMLYAYALSGLNAKAQVAEDGCEGQADDHQPQSQNENQKQGQYNALRDKSAALAESLGYSHDSKMLGWLHEHLPLLDARSLGFVHQLVDKIQQKLK
ncbi:tRNA/rRNA methyltransferase [Thalassolituus sp. LLYu03]|uniref:tRNA/rRNA methyltransferase n=1 Tax=Thalassolituus sp. LLYu03 TaxID=3421656 RepID=UPI003D2AB95C